MKALLMIILFGLSLNVQADEAKFQNCAEGDLNLVRVAQVERSKALKTFIEDEVLAEQTACVVKKPRFIHPAVCGTTIVQVDTFIIQTLDGATYTIEVDSSYRSCLRCRRIPTIKSFKYEETPEVIPFSTPIVRPSPLPRRC